jgi:hypothetical protein
VVRHAGQARRCRAMERASLAGRSGVPVRVEDTDAIHHAACAVRNCSGLVVWMSCMLADATLVSKT